jgi:hypothetical protein
MRSLVSVLDDTPWKVVNAAGRVRVEVGHPRFGPDNRAVPEEGFHLVAEVRGATVRHALTYFHDACHFAETANRMTSASEVITVLDPDIEHYEAVVRTGFRLPWPLQDREFLHYVTTDVSQDTEGRAVGLVAYATVTEDGQPPAWDGSLRCSMRASGQRITEIGDRGIRIEHGMTYPLGGRVGPWLQNHLFHAGHVNAYCNEGEKACEVLISESSATE